MFFKAPTKVEPVKPVSVPKKGVHSSVIAKDINLLGNIISEGIIDFDGTLNGNIHCHTLTIRAEGTVKGEITADHVFVYGTVKGLIRAKSVQLLSGCNVEGIIMHETLLIEDGAMVDGKFKRADKDSKPDESDSDTSSTFEESTTENRMLENIRLIR